MLPTRMIYCFTLTLSGTLTIRVALDNGGIIRMKSLKISLEVDALVAIPLLHWSKLPL